MKRFLLITISLLLTTCSPVFAGDTYDMIIRGGEDYRLEFTFTNDITRAAYDLTGCAYKAQARTTATAANAFATFSTAVINPTAGRLDIWLSRRSTAANSGANGYWDLRQTCGSTVSYPVSGVIKIQNTVTR